MKKVASETIKWLREDGDEVPEPFGTKTFKGKLALRLPAEAHREIAIKSAEEEVSITQYILSKL
jgi:predicted HicB family RNase H-like nuclease